MGTIKTPGAASENGSVLPHAVLTGKRRILFQHALARVVSDDQTRAELIARGRDRVRAFSWDETARALASCYRNLLRVR